MNILFLIGNGFDLNLGMKTRYRDFYDYYTNLPKDNDSDVVKSFKNELWNNIDLWSDLERELGNYLSKLDAKDAAILHDHLIEHLSQYIISEEEKCPVDEKQKESLSKYLASPHGDGRFSPVETREIDDFYAQWSATHRFVRIITFNYTKWCFRQRRPKNWTAWHPQPMANGFICNRTYPRLCR